MPPSASTQPAGKACCNKLMAAIFLNYQKDLFISNVNFTIPYNCAQLSQLDSGLSLVTNVGVQTSENIQYFMGFDDLITYLHFGKSVGAMVIDGMLFSDCRGGISGIGPFYNAVGGLRGSRVTLSLGGFSFTGVITNTNVSVMASPDTMASFSIHMAMIDHTLGGGVGGGDTLGGVGYSGTGITGSGGGLGGFKGSL